MPLDDDAASPQQTRDRLLRIIRRKLGEHGYTSPALEAKLDEIVTKQDLSFQIDWELRSVEGRRPA